MLYWYVFVGSLGFVFFLCLVTQLQDWSHDLCSTSPTFPVGYSHHQVKIITFLPVELFFSHCRVIVQTLCSNAKTVVTWEVSRLWLHWIYTREETLGALLSLTSPKPVYLDTKSVSHSFTSFLISVMHSINHFFSYRWRSSQMTSFFGVCDHGQIHCPCWRCRYSVTMHLRSEWHLSHILFLELLWVALWP